MSDGFRPNLEELIAELKKLKDKKMEDKVLAERIKRCFDSYWEQNIGRNITVLDFYAYGFLTALFSDEKFSPWLKK